MSQKFAQFPSYGLDDHSLQGPSLRIGLGGLLLPETIF